MGSCGPFRPGIPDTRSQPRQCAPASGNFRRQAPDRLLLILSQRTKALQAGQHQTTQIHRMHGVRTITHTQGSAQQPGCRLGEAA